MKKVVLFVLALIGIVLADDDKIENVAKRFESDVATVQTCLDEAGTKMEEINTSLQKWDEIKDDDINEETKASLKKYASFLACMLEKSDMMVDGKLVVDKTLDNLGKETELEASQKEVLTECLNSVNDDSEMGTREERVYGLLVCISSVMDEKSRR